MSFDKRSSSVISDRKDVATAQSSKLEMEELEKSIFRFQHLIPRAMLFNSSNMIHEQERIKHGVTKEESFAISRSFVTK